MEDKKTASIFGVLVFIVIVILASIFGEDDDASTKREVAKKQSCQSQSSTYYKCSYSYFEGRCVCKLR